MRFLFVEFRSGHYYSLTLGTGSAVGLGMISQGIV